jgi:hypothetical protein
VAKEQRPVYLDAIDGRAKQALQEFVAKQEKNNAKNNGKRAVHYTMPPPPPAPFRYARGDHKLDDGVKCVPSRSPTPPPPPLTGTVTVGSGDGLLRVRAVRGRDSTGAGCAACPYPQRFASAHAYWPVNCGCERRGRSAWLPLLERLPFMRSSTAPANNLPDDPGGPSFTQDNIPLGFSNAKSVLQVRAQRLDSLRWDNRIHEELTARKLRATASVATPLPRVAQTRRTVKHSLDDGVMWTHGAVCGCSRGRRQPNTTWTKRRRFRRRETPEFGAGTVIAPTACSA